MEQSICFGVYPSERWAYVLRLLQASQATAHQSMIRKARLVVFRYLILRAKSSRSWRLHHKTLSLSRFWPPSEFLRSIDVDDRCPTKRWSSLNHGLLLTSALRCFSLNQLVLPLQVRPLLLTLYGDFLYVQPLHAQRCRHRDADHDH